MLRDETNLRVLDQLINQEWCTQLEERLVASLLQAQWFLWKLYPRTGGKGSLTLQTWNSKSYERTLKPAVEITMTKNLQRMSALLGVFNLPAGLG